MANKRAGDNQARTQQQLLRQYEARKAVHEGQGRRRRRDNLIAVGAIVVVATLAGLAQFFYFSSGPGVPTPEPSVSATPTPGADATPGNIGDVPDPSLAEGRTWTGELTVNDTVLGVELDGALAPQAVSVLVQAANAGYYDGTSCHRLVNGPGAQLLQCGSLDGTGATDPTFSFGPLENTGVDGDYPAGTIAMARTSGDAYGNGRQFFIVTADTTLPDDAVGGYTIVGRVTSGLDALVDGVVASGTADGSSDGAPAVATVISAFTIQ